MAILKEEKSQRVANSKEFAETFEIEDEVIEYLKEDFDEVIRDKRDEPLTWENWECGEFMSDQFLIEKMLDGIDGYYFTIYIPENIGYIDIYKIDEAEIEG